MDRVNVRRLTARWGLTGFCALLLLALWCSSVRCQSYEDLPFDTARAQLPPGYYGYDPEAFVKGFEEATAKSQEARQKGEFETTAQYQERLKTPGSGSGFTSKTYAFAVKPTRVAYDADSQSFDLQFEPEPAQHNIQYVSTPLKRGAKDTGSYLAQNAFGATFTVTKSLYFSFELWLVRDGGVTSCAKSVKVELAEARALKPNIFALVIIKPAPPYVSGNRTVTDATFTRPEENTNVTQAIYGKAEDVRFYDVRDGHTLGTCP
jgi:hypothetical protein